MGALEAVLLVDQLADVVPDVPVVRHGVLPLLAALATRTQN
jgi:hypothetical protein